MFYSGQYLSIEKMWRKYVGLEAKTIYVRSYDIFITISVYQLEYQWAFLTSLCMSFVRLYIRMCIYRIFNFVWLSDLVPWSVPINHRLKSVRFSVRPFALPSVCLSVNFHFWFLLYLGENNSNCTKGALIIFINIFKLNLIKN